MQRICRAALLAAALTGQAQAADIEAGAKVFKKCTSCHAVGETAKIKTGPVLNDILGAIAGTNAEYSTKYSKAMIAAGAEGLVWSEETLTTYLTKPKAMIKGGKMNFAGLKKPDDLANVIAYLRQFSPGYTPSN